ERKQPGQESAAPREEARIVEFPKRPGAPVAPAESAAPTPAAAPEGELEPAAAAGPAAPEAAALADTQPAVEGASAIEAEIVVAPENLAGETRTPRAAGSPLAGPTLDDVMSRVWEGLATGLPAACPVCHGEVLPSRGGPLRGRCKSCDT